MYDFGRNIEEEFLYDCLLKQNVEGIIKQRSNRFRLYYKQGGLRINDLIIVIESDNNSTKKYSCNYI